MQKMISQGAWISKHFRRDEWKVTCVYYYSDGATFSVNAVSHCSVITVIQHVTWQIGNTSSPN